MKIDVELSEWRYVLFHNICNARENASITMHNFTLTATLFERYFVTAIVEIYSDD